MSLKERITNEVLDRGDSMDKALSGYVRRVRVESQDMRCLCETIAICFDELIAELRTLRETIESDQDPRKPEHR